MTKLTLNEQNYTSGSRPEVGGSVCFMGVFSGGFFLARHGDAKEISVHMRRNARRSCSANGMDNLVMEKLFRVQMNKFCIDGWIVTLRTASCSIFFTKLNVKGDFIITGYFNHLLSRQDET